MIAFLRLEILRQVRDVRYLILAVVLPVGFYLLFTNLFGSQGQRAEGLPQPVELMVSMAAYGAIWSVFSATAPRIAQERQSGWLRQLRLTPLSPAATMSGKLLAAVAAALPAMLLVCATAFVLHAVRLPVLTWAEMLGLLWIGSLPLALLGIAIGYLVGSDVAYGLIMVLYFALGALGGLWMPLSIMPGAIQTLALGLPSNRLADLGWKVAAGQAPAVSSLLVLFAWAVGGALLAFLAYRRSALR